MDNLAGELGAALTQMERERDLYRSALGQVLQLGLDLCKDPSQENLAMFEATLRSFPEDLRKEFSNPPSGLVAIPDLLRKSSSKPPKE